MITASHNPPSDNANKAILVDGRAVAAAPRCRRDRLRRAQNHITIHRGCPLPKGWPKGKIVYSPRRRRSGLHHRQVAGPKPSIGPARKVCKILYSPMHGVGASSICPVLKQAGFSDVEVFAPHAAPDGDFPNVPGHVANPEDPRTFESIIDLAKAKLAGRPGAVDRSRRRSPGLRRAGVQSRALAHVHRQPDRRPADRVRAGRSPAKGWSSSPAADHYVVKTLVTTEMVRRIADSYGVRTIGDLQVGFKFIGGAIDEAHGSGALRFGRRRIAWIPGRHVRPRQGCRGRSPADGRDGGAGPGRRPHVARAARRPVLATWLPCRNAVFEIAAGLRRNGPHAKADAFAAQRSAPAVGRPEREASSRLPERHGARSRAPAQRRSTVRWPCRAIW